MFADAYANNPFGPEEVGLEVLLDRQDISFAHHTASKSGEQHLKHILTSYLLSLNIDAIDSTLIFIAQESVNDVNVNFSKDEEATRICLYKI